jgi:DDE superfamily endonuclease
VRVEDMTGLDREQLLELTARVHDHVGGWTSRGRPFALGLYGSVAMVVALLRENLTQSFAGAVFGVSQSTVSRRWDLLRSLIEPALAEFVPVPAEVAGRSSVLVDGTLVPTWDWRCRDDLFSDKRGDHGVNLQVAGTWAGHQLVAVGAPIPGARHDAHAWHASGMATLLADLDVVGDLGYLGLGLTTGTRKPPGAELSEDRAQANQALSRYRARMEHIIAHVKNWKILSHRYRGPLDKLPEAIRAVVALHFFRYSF